VAKHKYHNEKRSFVGG